MTAELIDGKAYAAALGARVAALSAQVGQAPGLAVVLVGQDPASEIYVRSKGKQAVEAGMTSFEHRLPADTQAAELLDLIARLNTDTQVHGILVQLPLPPHLDARQVINAISPAKDVDGFHISNVGMVGTGQDATVPCTPLGCMMMLRHYHDDFRGKTALVIGHSNVVGKPMARLLLNADCTVIVAHKSSTNIPDLARMADILGWPPGCPVWSGPTGSSRVPPSSTLASTASRRRKRARARRGWGATWISRTPAGPPTRSAPFATCTICPMTRCPLIDRTEP